MRFWDASAIVPLLVAEPTTRAVRRLAEKDPAMIVWWAAEVECASAIARLELDAAVDGAAAAKAFDRLKRLADSWHEVDPSDPIREAAVRFLRVHRLHSADALQLAAAFMAAERRPSSLEVVTLDERLAGAARKEGFPLIEVAAAV
jgi:predicted nucleic acid-binding protein